MAKSKAKQPTIDTCWVSHKPIRQKHIDDGKVITYHGRRAFLKAVENSVPNPPENPIVISIDSPELDKTEYPDKVSLSYVLMNFPKRYIVNGKGYKKRPNKIWIKDTCYKLAGWKAFPVFRFMALGKHKDGMLESGCIHY